MINARGSPHVLEAPPPQERLPLLRLKSGFTEGLP